MMTSLLGRRVTAVFPEQLDFFQLENSIKFVLIKILLVVLVSMAFSHLPYILAHDFFSIGKVERQPSD